MSAIHPPDTVLYRYVCMTPGCGAEYDVQPVPRTYEEEAEVVSHGLCNHCAYEHHGVIDETPLRWFDRTVDRQRSRIFEPQRELYRERRAERIGTALVRVALVAMACGFWVIVFQFARFIWRQWA